MQRLQPALNVERLDVLGNLLPPAGDEMLADNLLRVKRGAFGFRAHGVRPEVSPQVVLAKGVEMDAPGFRNVIDAQKQAKLVHLAPGGFLAREIPNETDRQGVFNPPAFRVSDPEPEHPPTKPERASLEISPMSSASSLLSLGSKILDAARDIRAGADKCIGKQTSPTGCPAIAPETAPTRKFAPTVPHLT